MSHIQIERQGPVTVLRVDRPPANAFDLTLAAELVEALHTLEAESWGALVVAGRPRFFSAGIDVKATPHYSNAERATLVASVEMLIGGLYRSPRPVVTAVTGHAMGGGLILALCGDHRVCTDDPDARLALPEVRIGVPFPDAPMDVVRRELSASVARRLALGDQTLGPAEALALGVVDELVPPDQVVPRAIAVAGELAARPTEAWQRTKRALRTG